MNRILKYINNISALQFIQLLRFANLFLIGIVFVRIFSAEQIGYYETLIFIAGAVSFFWLRGILQSFLALSKNESKEKNESYFNGFILLFVCAILAAIFLFVFRQSFSDLLNNSETVKYFKWLLLYIIFGSPANLIEYIYLSSDKPKSIITYGSISQGLQFLFVVIPAIAGFDLEYSIIGLVAINVLRFLWLLIILEEYSSYKVSLPFIKRHIILAYPLVLSGLLSGSAQYIDGLLITYYYDSAVFAIFRYGARELPLALILANAFSNAMIPEFSKLSLQEVLAKLKRNSTRLIHILFPITIVLLVSSNWLFPRIFTQDYAFSAKIFNVYLLLVISRLLFPQTILIGLQRTKDFLWVSAIEIFLNVALSILFIHWFGVIGVAYATIIANPAEKIILMSLVKVKLKIPISDYVPGKVYGFYSIFVLIIYVLTDFYWF